MCAKLFGRPRQKGSILRFFCCLKKLKTNFDSLSPFTFKQTIDAITDAIKQHENVALIDVDSGASTNRTVYTIVGRPANVIDSIISAAKGNCLG